MSKQVISILGSTGSIGCNTLKVVEYLREPEFRVVALGAGKNIGKLAEQVIRFHPELVSVATEECAEELLKLLSNSKIKTPKIKIGEAGLVAVATHDEAEMVVSATVGAIGFVPTLRALEAGKRVCLANKETLVMAGELMTKAARDNKAEILPVDSEHNAIHQCLRGETRAEVKRLILTASGGPFRTWTTEAMRVATPEQALQHPNWSMGTKITIDSATLMNKGLELIEAFHLFPVRPEAIEIVVHPQSVIHSLVEYVDGSVLAQLGPADMRVPIASTLAWPARMATPCMPLDLVAIGRLDFEAPDPARFPALALARQALADGGAKPAILNAANEVAVASFLESRIGFLDIAAVVDAVLAAYDPPAPVSIDDVLDTDREARRIAAETTGKIRP